ncbi:hypothetical protein MPH_09854 [Macrophomina phaseolina MS6]|uniref:Uncharacterized protein n=2 Tax=Macrophomina phaseolina TaxID=35725 RepID=K2RS54_MACPH|nr:hypothetical protein MPH_09854 [Macrophomina phaseolina MS6]KAH7030179.1 hypothetical protein B0J12DRAFT_682164 [Macrophomina phaseolina]
MTGIVQSLESLVASFFSLIGDVLNGILSAFQSVVAVIFTFFQHVAGLFQDLISFLLHNIVIIGVIAAAGFVWLTVQQNRGASVTGQKKSA